MPYNARGMLKLVAFLIGVAMAIGVWYWFVVRPEQIRKQCLEVVAQSDIEEAYKSCLRSHGLSE
jgi:hypothetical protein